MNSNRTLHFVKKTAPESAAKPPATGLANGNLRGCSVVLSTESDNYESRRLSGRFPTCDHFVVERQEFHHDFVRDSLTALPCVESRDGRLIDARPTLDFLLRQLGAHQFGNKFLRVHGNP